MFGSDRAMIWSRFFATFTCVLLVACEASVDSAEEGLPSSTNPPSTTITDISTTAVETTAATTTTTTSTTTSTPTTSTTTTSTTSSTTSSTTVAPTTTVAAPASTTTTTTTPGEDGYPVVEVVDGDTIVISVDGAVDTLRLIGINSPEQNECYSDESHAFLKDLLDGERVTLEVDQTDRDQYDRLLRYVYLGDGTFVNEVMVEEGMAIARRYPPDTNHAETLEAAQSRAREAELGLWAPDACGDSTEADLEITEIYFDPPGNETEDLNAEFIVITNNGAPLDMGGWGIRDESSSNRFTFPSGFSLGSGASVTIHSGCGDPSPTNLYWCSSYNAIWNNDGDTVFVQDPDGNTVVSRSY